MSNCTAKPINTFRSRYLVVRDDIMMPRPSPMPAIIKTNTGIINNETPKCTGIPLTAKKINTAANNKNWIPNFTRLDITVDNGMTTLGKYTFPKMPALATNVLEVLLRHEEKYFHIVMPLI